MAVLRTRGTRERKYRQKYGRADWPSFAGPEQNGHADLSARTIGIRADIPAWLACEVAAHEVAHLALPGRDRDADEEAATAYGEWAAEIVMPHGKLVDVHLFDGHPYDGYALAGVADHGDVVVANDDGKVGVFRNAGSRRRPEWLRHHATSPVDDEESSVRAGTA